MTREELIQSLASRKLRAEVHRLTKGKKGIPVEEAREKAIRTLTERRTGKPASGPPKTGRVSKTSDKTPTEDSLRRTDARMYLFRNHLPSEIQDPTYAGPGSREEKVAEEGTRSNVKKLGVKSELDMTPKGKRSERIATWKSAAETASKAPKKYATTLGVAKEAQKAGDTSSRAKKAIRAVHTVRRGVAINEAISMARAKGRSSKADEAEGKRFWPTYESGSQEDPNTKTKRENAKKPTRLMRVEGNKPASSTPRPNEPQRGPRDLYTGKAKATPPVLAGMKWESPVGKYISPHSLYRSKASGDLKKTLLKGEEGKWSGISHPVIPKVDLRHGKGAPNPSGGNPEFNPVGKRFETSMPKRKGSQRSLWD